MSDPTLPGIITGRLSATRDRLLARIAGAYPPKAAAITVTIGLIVHEVAYHLTGGNDFPLVLLASDTRILVISHGGLDALGVGALAITAIAGIDVARARLERR